ncbi:hypothetical protein [Stenomitos frigidus]|uniref:hypothetical protein n=1 Tax=Stenomitos frigidus TaxID=1886765 RepID=UPI001C62976D|nr:hypothetical protein [Stenomitos frigidus]
MKVAQYGTAIVVLHAIAHGLHGLAHTQIPVPLSLLQSVFIAVVIFLIPIVAAVLLWTPFDRIGSWLLLGSMAGAILFGIYNHFIVMSPDHVSHVSFTGWGLLFQITAMLTLAIDGIGCWFSVQTLKAVPQLEKVSSVLKS